LRITGDRWPSHPKMARTMKTFSNMEINDAAITELKTFSPTLPDQG
jgi:hypothetical protein